MDQQTAAGWDQVAATFDQPGDHGLKDPAIRSAWASLLARTLPPAPARIADIGCGTGSLAVLAADLGHGVDGVDFSEAMLAIARDKAAGRERVTFTKGDASRPPLAAHAYDAVICRHVLWTLPDPSQALTAWTRLLIPGGRLVLIEGRWSTGVGLSSDQTAALLTGLGLQHRVESLADPAYWGTTPTDQRYVALARLDP